MRLFVAVEIAPAVAAAVHDLTTLLRQRAVALAPAARVTWIPADRLHLTIRFVGPVPPDVAIRIADVLRPTLDVRAFRVAVAGTGVFPPRGRPVVFWAGVADDEGRLAALEAEVSGRLHRLGIPRESRPFRAHLTLGRVRSAAGLRPAALFDGLERRALGTTGIEAITLFESRLSPPGPQYVALQRTGLSLPDAAPSGA